jgi:hypothetical protein
VQSGSPHEHGSNVYTEPLGEIAPLVHIDLNDTKAMAFLARDVGKNFPSAVRARSGGGKEDESGSRSASRRNNVPAGLFPLVYSPKHSRPH